MTKGETKNILSLYEYKNYGQNIFSALFDLTAGLDCLVGSDLV